jgi:hypothetical protein
VEKQACEMENLFSFLLCFSFQECWHCGLAVVNLLFVMDLWLMLFVRSYGCHMPLLKVGLVIWSLSLFQVSTKTGLVTCGTSVIVHSSYAVVIC